MNIINSVSKPICPNMDAICKRYVQNVVDVANGVYRNLPIKDQIFREIRNGWSPINTDVFVGGYLENPEALPIRPLRKHPEIFKEIMKYYRSASSAFMYNYGKKYPYGVTKDGVPIITIFEKADIALDARGRAVLLKKVPVPPTAETTSLRTRIDVDYAYAQ